MQKYRIIPLIIVFAFAAGIGLAARTQHRVSADRNVLQGKFPYRSKEFNTFVAESYTVGNAGRPEQFYQWFDSAYRSSKLTFHDHSEPSIQQMMSWEREKLARVKGVGNRTQEEVALGAWLHKLVKKTVTKFSLDRGFEFYYTVKYGERQCFLQSVLISSLLQRAGADAGVVMVYRSPSGQESNNGHAVVLLKLPNGRDIIVDASEKEPFAKQQGLFVKVDGYRYVEPIYAKDSETISSYHSSSDGSRIRTSKVHTLDTRFLRSQFWYYRGERTKGGLLDQNKTTAGLKESERYLRTSVRYCPENPLAVYMLGRVYLAEGKIAGAHTILQKACDLYAAFGWTPAGPPSFLAKARI